MSCDLSIIIVPIFTSKFSQFPFAFQFFYHLRNHISGLPCFKLFCSRFSPFCTLTQDAEFAIFIHFPRHFSVRIMKTMVEL